MTCNEQLNITIKEACLLSLILEWMENSLQGHVHVFKFESECGDNHRGNRSRESLHTVTTLETVKKLSRQRQTNLPNAFDWEREKSRFSSIIHYSYILVLTILLRDLTIHQNCFLNTGLAFL